MTTKEKTMTKYVSNDGEVFEASTPAELVREMRTAAFKKGKNETEYRAMVAEVATTLSGSKIRSGSADELVEDLLSVGFIKVAKDGEDPFAPGAPD